MKQVAITGAGAVTPLGLNARATLENLCSGKSGVGRITRFPAETFDVRIAGEVPIRNPEDLVCLHPTSPKLSTAGYFGLSAALEAVESSGVDKRSHDVHPFERGLFVGSTAARPPLNAMIKILESLKLGAEAPENEMSQLLNQDQNVIAQAIANTLQIGGPIVNISTACAASAHAIGEGYRTISDGSLKTALVGGYDSLITWLDVLGFSLLGALTERYQNQPFRASRPFDSERSGFVLGEGAAMFQLEELTAARARGARVIGQIVGYASTMNAYRITDPPPLDGGVTQCMKAAIADASISPSDIGYIAAHGTSTPANDANETNAIKAVFGSHTRDLVVSSVKSMTGHLTAAAAGLGLFGALSVLNDGRIPPTINLENPDPECDLDFATDIGRVVKTDYVMVNAFAFGGTNACLIVKRGE